MRVGSFEYNLRDLAGSLGAMLALQGWPAEWQGISLPVRPMAQVKEIICC